MNKAITPTPTLFGLNVANLLKHQNKSQTELARHCGLSDASVSAWISGKTSSIEGQNLVAAAEFFDVHPAELLNKLIDVNVVKEEKGRYSAPNSGFKLRSIPIVGRIETSHDGRLAFQDTAEIIGKGMVLFSTSSNSAYAVSIAGDEYRPRFKPGESVVVDPARTPEPGHEVFVRMADGAVHVVVLDWMRNGLAQFSSVNEVGRPFTLQESAITSIHRIIGSAQPDLQVY